MDYFKMNLHVSIAYKLWFSLKGHSNYILVISKLWYKSKQVKRSKTNTMSKI
jgi:hypothetical protein